MPRRQPIDDISQTPGLTFMRSNKARLRDSVETARAKRWPRVTRVILDSLPAACFIAGHFGWSAPTFMTLTADGAMGRIWRLDTDSTSYAVKELYWAKDVDVEEKAVARQVLFCEKARAAGVTAPTNLRTRSGQYVIALPQAMGGRLICAYECIEGRPITPADAAWAGHTEAIIEGLGVLPGDQELDPWSYVCPSVEAWYTLASRGEVAQQPWADRLRKTIPPLVALADSVTAPVGTSLIVTHTDFQRQNVLVATDGRFVLLDWDDAGPSTRSRALAGSSTTGSSTAPPWTMKAFDRC